MADFKVGIRVKLNSGGPIMTIVTMRDGVATCAWFDGNAESRSDYPLEAIQIKGPMEISDESLKNA